MKTGFASQKVPGGKLLQIQVECDSSTIQKVNITGDFFLHPEEAITDLEACLSGLPIAVDVQVMIQRITELVQSRNLTLVGVAPADIAGTLQQAIVMCQV